MDITNNHLLPYEISLSFDLLIKHYQERYLIESNELVKEHLARVLKKIEKHPKLSSGIKTSEELESLKDVIDVLMGDLFPQALSLNEIKGASIPFQSNYFYSSTRFKNIVKDAGNHFKFQLLDLSEDEMYVISCNYILASYYKVNTNYQRPMYCSIPDRFGNVKTYKLAINADYVKIEPTDKTIHLTESDIDQLLQSNENVNLWKEKFPPNTWVSKGFLLVNFIDVTVDTIISDLKSDMLNHTITDDNFDGFQSNFRKFFNNQEILIGFTKYDSVSDSFVKSPGKQSISFVLGKMNELHCKTGFCVGSYKRVISKNKYLSVSDIDNVLLKGKNEVLSRLQKQGIKSCIIAPIVVEGELIGTLEIVSPNKNDLTAINAKRLDIIMPYLVATSKRSIQESENYLKLIIQNECTSIHPSVLWKFEKEAERYMNTKFANEGVEAIFNDIAFEHVFPLFGQIDIIGSSTIRNDSIQADFVKQLQMVKTIFALAYQKENLAFYEQVELQIISFIEDIESNFNTTSEEQLLYFLKNEVNPIMPHIKQLSADLGTHVQAYDKAINVNTGIIYDQRKKYEDSVQSINVQMASFIDKKQKEAQLIYPHYFERFKTDGVEHNMYIGKSLVNDKAYNTVYLKNLRLWQLTTMCEMERNFYEIQDDFSVKLSCASLILVFGNSLTIKFRVDEKKFDVDGSYNARYEIIKKRIDKAKIKGTDERITQKGKLVIVYSQKKDELEYLKYIQFLQNKKYLENEIELVVLEDLQGVVGLKAIRVNINYNTPDEKITYNDLLKEINK